MRIAGGTGDAVSPRHARFFFRSRRDRLLRRGLGIRPPLPAARGSAMSLEYGIGLAVALVLGVYLTYALLVPERF